MTNKPKLVIEAMYAVIARSAFTSRWKPREMLRSDPCRSRTKAIRRGIWAGPAGLCVREAILDYNNDAPLTHGERKAWRKLRTKYGYRIATVWVEFEDKSHG